MAAWINGFPLGPYVLLAPIGAGGMGEVWKARDTRLNRMVAVKRLKGQHSARFEQEARAIAALNHPHICQIFDVGPDYLVLEYIEGQPLLSRAKPGPLAVEEAVRLATQIAEALDAAHRKGVVHRDLKPANIMVTSEGSVKLLDFGLAKQMPDSDEAGIDETETIEGTVMGTAAYMAPEQAEGKPLDARSDIFSFGAVLYELLSGRRAFRGENSISTMAAILHNEPAPLDAPAALQQIVKRCLAKPPEQRYQTMAEVREALGKGGAHGNAGATAALHRGAAVRQHEPRQGKRILQRRAGRGDHQLPGADSGAEGDRAHFVVRVPRQGAGHPQDRRSAARANHSRRQRAPIREVASA